MLNKRMDKLAKQIVIASNNAISYDAARQRVETYYHLKRKHPIRFFGEHLSLDSIAKIMANGMLGRV